MSNALPARDQSMDEILASIRRIIETGDERLARNATALDAAARSPTAPSAARSHQDPVSSGRPMPDMASQSDEIAAARLRSEYLAAGSDAAAADHSAFPSAVSEASRVSANAPRSIRRPAVDVAGDLPNREQYPTDVFIRVPLSATETTPVGLVEVGLEVRHQGCRPGLCFPPTTTPLTALVPVRSSD